MSFTAEQLINKLRTTTGSTTAESDGDDFLDPPKKSKEKKGFGIHRLCAVENDTRYVKTAQAECERLNRKYVPLIKEAAQENIKLQQIKLRIQAKEVTDNMAELLHKVGKEIESNHREVLLDKEMCQRFLEIFDRITNHSMLSPNRDDTELLPLLEHVRAMVLSTVDLITKCIHKRVDNENIINELTKYKPVEMDEQQKEIASSVHNFRKKMRGGRGFK